MGRGEVRGEPGSEVTPGATGVGVVPASAAPRWRPAGGEAGFTAVGCGCAGAEHLSAPAGGAAEHLCAALNALDKCRVFPWTALLTRGAFVL